jgi:hypothetical protein
MKKPLLSSLLLVLLAGVQLGARAATAKSWPILEVSSQTQCAWLARDAAAHIFESEEQWLRIVPAGQPQAFTRLPDWKRQVIVGLTLGARPTSGYTIELNGKQFELRNDTLWLGFRERKPAAGEIQQEAVTQPCIFILTRRGQWRQTVLQNIDSGSEFRDELSDKFSADLRNDAATAPGARATKTSYRATGKSGAR